MNLLWKKLFGSLPATDKLEKEELALLMDYKKYCDIETSEQLAEYTRLFHIIKAADFKEKKKTLQNRKFKDTHEYRDLNKFEKLSNSADLKLYFQVVDSAELKAFLAFKDTAEYELLGNPKEVKANPDLAKFKAYEKSKAYKTYVRFHNSYILEEFDSLKKSTSTAEFIKEKNFWQDAKRWEKTEEFKVEQSYYALQKSPEISFYEATDPKKFDILDTWMLTFEDNFDGDKLDASKWQAGYYHRAAAIKKNYSFANEKQANVAGKNVSLGAGLLKITTKAEKLKALAWDTTKGFVERDFEFSSDIINSGEAFQQQNGLIKAKLRVAGSTDVSHAFWMGTDGKLPHVNIFHYNGKNIQVSTYAGDANNVSVLKEKITGINATDFYIYSLEWTATELIWKINDLVVFRAPKSPNVSMFPVFNSFVSETQKGGNAALEVDWVKIFTKK